jgi:hypothetical protein
MTPNRSDDWDFGPIVDEAVDLVREAGDTGMALRLIGSLGVRMHCRDAERTQDRFDRNVKDIDVVCRRADRHHLRRFMIDRGYDVDRDVLIAMEGERYLFRHPKLGVELDVFVDPLDFCHRVHIGPAIDEHPLSIPVEQLVLHKLQIVELTHGDYVDLYTVLLTHEVSRPDRKSDDPELISSLRIAQVLASDWGFHRTATSNLDRLTNVLRDPHEELPELNSDEARVVGKRVDLLREAIEGQPKSLGWRVRAKVGERVQWWQDVDVPREAY